MTRWGDAPRQLRVPTDYPSWLEAMAAAKEIGDAVVVLEPGYGVRVGVHGERVIKMADSRTEPQAAQVLWAPVMIEIVVPGADGDLPDLDEVCEELMDGLYRRMIDAADPANHGWAVRTIRPNRQAWS